MIPATANIEVCLMNNRAHWDYYNGFWGDVYGFKGTILSSFGS